MDAPVPAASAALTNEDERLMLRLAREIAMDIVPIDKILSTFKVDPLRWDIIQRSARFQAYLSAELELWASAVNTQERVRIKSLAFIEESLPEFYARVHDPKETLASKTEVLKAISRLAGVGQGNGHEGVGGERFSVTINLGADKTLKIEKDVTPRGNPAFLPVVVDNSDLG